MEAPDLSSDEGTIAFLSGRRCMHGRQAIAAELVARMPCFMCAREAAAWAEHGWRGGRYPRARPGTEAYERETRGRRWFGLRRPRRTWSGEIAFQTGRPPAALPVACECDCECDWAGTFGSVSIEDGVIRCPACVAAGHPPLWRGEGLDLEEMPCGCGRQTLLHMTSTFGGEDRLCAGDLGSADGSVDWPDPFPLHPYGTAAWKAEFRNRPFLRHSSGRPNRRLRVACECACRCGWSGPFGEVSLAGGVIRCPGCVAAAHPPVWHGMRVR